MRLRLLREPLFAFLVAGGALFLLYSWLRQPDAIVLNKGTRTALLAEFEMLTGRNPDAADVGRIEREYVADELLFRAALDAGVHRSNSAVRGELIEEMRRRIAGAIPDPSVEDLLDHYSDHLDRYHAEPTASFEHVFFVAGPQDAAAILARLRRQDTVAGDAFDHGLRFDRYGRSMLRGMFGEEFVTAIWAAPGEDWFGPVPSVRGWHFVRVSARAERELRPFPEVRDQVENDWIAARIQAAVELKLAELAANQPIVIER